MKLGIFFLILAYCFSQFYRAFLAVLSPVLAMDIGAGPDDLAFASGVWFIAFAAMQIVVGACLDRFGPRLTASVIFGLGAAGGALVFAQATTPTHITLAMAMIGIGCSPVLMAGYYIFAKTYSAAVFATLAGVMLGTGSLHHTGTQISASPALPYSLIFGMFGVTSICGLLAFLRVQDRLD